MPALQSQLHEFQAHALAHAPAAAIGTIKDWNTELSASDIVGRSLRI